MTSHTAHSAGNPSSIFPSVIFFAQHPDQTLDIGARGYTEMSGLGGVLAFARVGFNRENDYRPVAQTDKYGLTRFISKCNDQLFSLNNQITALSTTLAYAQKAELQDADLDGVLFLITGLSEITNEIMNAMSKAHECLENGWFLESPAAEI